jgi:uncharacterized repeat protein (TIGR03803 family)
MRVISAIIVLCVLFIVGSVWGQSAAAKNIQVLHSFRNVPECGDGCAFSQVSADAAGNLFGAAEGGAIESGLIYELMPQPGKRQWKYKVIHTFCQRNGCIDGSQVVFDKLVVDVAGNVYGTTSGGGRANRGIVFELSPNGRGGWIYSVIYNFCSAMNCRDGMSPVGNLTYAGDQQRALYDGTSPLYGATSAGGSHFSGTAFVLSERVNGHRQEDVLYAFCIHNLSGCPDGSTPSGGMTMDASGNIFGLTFNGGATNRGTLFKLTVPTARNGGRWTEAVVHNFCALANCSDGVTPQTELVVDGSGNIYGTTVYGGTGANCPSPVNLGCGVLYEIAPDDTYTVLHEFCSNPNCADGATSGRVVMDASGNLFGTAMDATYGFIFEFADGTYQAIYNFCAQRNCKDGEFPTALTVDSTGRIFGLAAGGGKFGVGTAYEFSE